jgi:hypothetical protein
VIRHYKWWQEKLEPRRTPFDFAQGRQRLTEPSLAALESHH